MQLNAGIFEFKQTESRQLPKKITSDGTRDSLIFLHGPGDNHKTVIQSICVNMIDVSGKQTY